MSKALFVTGTGTDTGKTYITGLIVKKLQEAQKNPAYYKAAMSGNDRRPDGTLIPGDALAVQTLSLIHILLILGKPGTVTSIVFHRVFQQLFCRTVHPAEIF